MLTVIHLYGASGSGTSTLGLALANALGYKWMDTDDYYWRPTDPPYTIKRSREERIALIRRDITRHGRVVLSGSLVDWGDGLIPLFTLAVRVTTDTETRIGRIRARERQKFGERILPGGDMHAQHERFVAWAGGYDTGDLNTRSKARHDAWERLLTCRRIVVNGAEDVQTNVGRVRAALDA